MLSFFRIAPLVVAVFSGLVFACSANDDGAEAGSNDLTSSDTNLPAALSASESPSTDPAIGSLANIGDSMSQAFDADDKDPIDVNAMLAGTTTQFHDVVSLSWIQGTDPRIGSVTSHYKTLNGDVVETPVSRSGAELVGADTGVPNFAQQAQSLAGKNPQLVYILLGGNDVCNRKPAKPEEDPTTNMYSIDQWRTGIQAGLAALVDVLPEAATVRFLSMPRVDLLVEKVAGSTVPMKFDAGIFGDLTPSSTCQGFWGTAAAGGKGICSIVTLEQDQSRRAAIGARVDAYNDALAAEVRSWNGDATKNAKGITFQSDWHGSLASGAAPNSSVGTFSFDPDMVSKRDCFHPSILGQHTMAALVQQTSRFTAK